MAIDLKCLFNLGLPTIPEIYTEALSYTEQVAKLCGAVYKVGEQSNINEENIKKKVSFDDMTTIYKMDKNANFTGSWHGIKKPTQSNEGLAGAVDQIIEETIPNLQEQINNKVNVQDFRSETDLLNLKLTGLNNVKIFGAKGDGETDDTLAIQQALDTIKTGYLFFPKGIYKVSETLKLKYNAINIKGECSQATYLKMVGNGVPLIEYKSEDERVLSGGKIENISLYYESGTQSISSGISLDKLVNFTMEDVIIQGFKTGLYISHVGNSYFKHVGIVSDVNNAILFNVGNKSVSTYFTSCYGSFYGGAVDTGIGFLMNEGNIADVNIEYLDIGNGAYGIFIDGIQSPSDFPPADINIKNIVVDASRLGCIYINNINERGNINIIGGWLNPLSINNAKCVNINNSNNVNISNITLQQLANISPNAYGVTCFKCKNITINNSMFLNLISGFSISDTNNFKCSNNIFRLYDGLTANSYAINFDNSSKLIIVNNIIEGTYLKDIVVNNGNTSIIKNNLLGTSKIVENNQLEKIVSDNL